MLFLLLESKLSDQFLNSSDLTQSWLFSLTFSSPNMFAMFESESKVSVFLGQTQCSFCFSLAQSGLAAWEVET